MHSTATIPPARPELVSLRRALHRRAERSGAEGETAAFVAERLGELRPDALLTGLGGHGVAARFDGAPGAAQVLIRAELDALPIPETPGLPHGSLDPLTSHRCGHDGHMAMALAAARRLRDPDDQSPGPRGTLWVLFQPAEEIGTGARAVVADPRWAQIKPDVAIALHNLPGRPLGEVGVRAGPAHCASVGWSLHLRGRPAHAAEPERGLSPALALGTLLAALHGLADRLRASDGSTLVTVVAASLGDGAAPAFGVAPSDASLHATLRAATDEGLAELVAAAEEVAHRAAGPGLRIRTEQADHFAATVNDPRATELAQRAADALGLERHTPTAPHRWSEDFGVYALAAPQPRTVMIGLGAGTAHPALHSDEYDFPDDLLPIGAALLAECARRAWSSGLVGPHGR